MTRVKKYFTTDKEFYRLLLAIAIPIALQNLINFSVAMADTVMLGFLGQPEQVEAALAAANLANKFSTIFTLFTFGLGGGGNVIISQYWGKGDKESIRRIISIIYRALFCGAAVFSLIAIVFPTQAMALFSADPVIQQYGADYLRIVGFSYLLSGFVAVTTTIWRSIGTVRIALVVYLSSLATNVLLNWVFIFGNLGAPRLEMKGAAIGTLAARVVEVGIVLIFMAKHENKIGYRLRDFFRSSAGHFKNFRNLALPVVINEIIWGLGSTLLSVIIGHMGRELTAADSVCTILSQLVTIFIWGVGHASAAIIGNTIGRGEHEKARQYSHTLMALSVGLGIVSSVIVLLLRNPMAAMFKLTDTAELYAKQIITVYAIVVIFQAISAIGLIGILRGAGNSRFVLIMDVVFMWLICLPLGAIAGLKLALPVAAVYAILRSDEVFKASAAIFRLSKGNWIQNISIPDTAGTLEV